MVLVITVKAWLFYTKTLFLSVRYFKEVLNNNRSGPLGPG